MALSDTLPDDRLDPASSEDRQIAVNVIRRKLEERFSRDWNDRCPHVAYFALTAPNQLGISGYRIAAGRVEEMAGDPPAVLFKGDYTGTGKSQYHTWLVNAKGEKIDCSVVPIRYNQDHVWEPYLTVSELTYAEVTETTKKVLKGLERTYGDSDANRHVKVER